MTCTNCNLELPKCHNTHTTILFYTCKCETVLALDKGKLRALKPNEKAFIEAVTRPN